MSEQNLGRRFVNDNKTQLLKCCPEVPHQNTHTLEVLTLLGTPLTLQRHSLFLKIGQKTGIYFTHAHLDLKQEPLGQALGRGRDGGKLFCSFKCDLGL